MSQLPNIAEFKMQLAQVVAKLFAAFPSLGSVKGGTEMSNDGIRWLLREGIVNGKLQEPLNGPITLYNAQFSGHALRILQQPEENAMGEILGTLVVRTMAGQDTSDHQAVADIVARRLLDI